MNYFRFGLSINKFDVDHYTDWNMIFKEVANIEVDKTMIYCEKLLCVVTNWSKNIKTEKMCNYSLAEQSNERKIKFLRICSTQSMLWFQGIY